MITKSFGHICYLNEHGLNCFPRELFPGHNHVLGEEISPENNLNCVPLGSNHVLLGSTPKSCSPGEQMCSKLCIIITFAFEFWLKCFQLQSCISPWDLSNDSSQTYIYKKMRWPWLLKVLKHMFPRGTWAFPRMKLAFPLGRIMSPGRSLSYPRSNLNLFFPWEQSCPLRRSLSCLGELMCLKFCLISTCKKDTYNIIHYVNTVKKIQIFFVLLGIVLQMHRTQCHI